MVNHADAASSMSGGRPVRETKSRHAVKRDGGLLKCCCFCWCGRSFKDC
jgi:hypothetical protein